MGKPILEVGIETYDGEKGRVRAVFDTGAHRTLIRESCLPAGATVVRRPVPEKLRTHAELDRRRPSGGRPVDRKAPSARRRAHPHG